MRQLRQTLASIALAAPLAGCPMGCPDNKPIEETIALPAMPDADLATLIANCKQQMNCEPLCAEIYMRQHGMPGSYFMTCELTTDAATGGDAVHYIEERVCIGGRRPHGYRGGRPCGGLAVAAYLAQQAELEAASVRAFADLHADLLNHGAPAALRRATIAAAGDEIRHARTCARLAHRHGITPVFARVAPALRRARRELAIENAVEGCVRETYGAVLAGFQARAAGDPAIRQAMRGIARDEAKHAALSWRLHRWLAPQLDARERRAVEDAMRFARAELAPVADDPEVHRVAGLPEPAAATALLAELDTRVWS